MIPDGPNSGRVKFSILAGSHFFRSWSSNLSNSWTSEACLVATEVGYLPCYKNEYKFNAPVSPFYASIVKLIKPRRTIEPFFEKRPDTTSTCRRRAVNTGIAPTGVYWIDEADVIMVGIVGLAILLPDSVSLQWVGGAMAEKGDGRGAGRPDGAASAALLSGLSMPEQLMDRHPSHFSFSRVASFIHSHYIHLPNSNVQASIRLSWNHIY